MQRKEVRHGEGTGRNRTKHTNAMDIGLHIWLQAPSDIVHERHIIVHYHVDLHDIDPASDDVRRDEHLLLPVSKPVDDGVPF